MASFVKYQQFVEDLAVKVHNLGSDTLKVMLTNTGPDAATNEIRSHAAEISSGNGYSSGGNSLTVTSAIQTGGVFKLVINDTVFTASSGVIGPFRYAIIYNDTPTSPADPLIGYWDYGSSITLADGETFTVDFDASNGVLTIT